MLGNLSLQGARSCAAMLPVCNVWSSFEHTWQVHLPPFLQAAGLITAVVVMSAAAFTTHAVRYQGVGAAPHPPLVYAVLLGFLLLPINFAFPVSACPASVTACLPARRKCLSACPSKPAHGVVNRT